MIKLSTHRGIVDIQDWEDIETRPGFTNNLDPKNLELEAVLGVYSRNTYINCGLSSCHQPHQSGYLIQLKNGQETNIGGICGKTHFGFDFTSLKNKLDKDVDYSNKIEALKIAKFSITDKNNHLCEIESDFNFLEKIYSNIQAENLDELTNKIEILKRNKSPIISSQRLATKAERELEEARTGKTVKKPFYIDETLGELKGFYYIMNRHKIKPIIYNGRNFLKKLDSFTEEDSNFKELKTMINQNSDLEDDIDEAKKIIIEGYILFKKSNFQQFEKIIDSKKHRRLKRFLESCII